MEACSIRECHRRHTGQQGITLLELMVTLAVAVILITLVVPSFNQLMQSNTARSLNFELQSTLNWARSEAINRNRPIRVCVKKTGLTECAPWQGNWHQGWLVFIDLNGDGSYEAANDELLRLKENQDGSYRFRSNNGNQQIVFRPNGMAAGNRSFRLCMSDGNQNYGLVLANSGRVRSVNLTIPADQLTASEQDTQNNVRNVNCPS